MEFQTIKKERSYIETNDIARSPTLQTILMVEKFIDENSGEYKKTDLFKNLPKKVMWQTFQVIMEYLESVYKIVYDKKNCIGGLICVDIAPEFWRMDGAVATINNQKATKDKDKEELIFDEKDLSHNLEAAEGCPVAVIKIIDLETGEQLYPKE